MGGKILRIARTKLKEKNKVEGLMLSDFKTYYKAPVIKTVCFWGKNRQIDLWNRKRMQKQALIYIQLIFDKEAKAIQWSKDGAEKMDNYLQKI